MRGRILHGYGRPLDNRENLPMKRHHERIRVPYGPRQMYDLVMDVTLYPTFIPWCEALRIITDQRVDGSGEMVADMVVGYKVFREKFRSHVTGWRGENDQEAPTILVRYQDGPLRDLTNAWRFEPNEDGGCTIDFTLEFAFKNMFMQMAAQQLVDKAFSRMAQAFITRADALYGKKV